MSPGVSLLPILCSCCPVIMYSQLAMLATASDEDTVTHQGYSRYCTPVYHGPSPAILYHNI